MTAQLLKREAVYHGRAFSVRRDRVRLASGHETEVDVVVHSGAVTLVPVDGLGHVWMVRQYRHSAESVLLELPAGTLETGELPLACAGRECREEIGMAPGRLQAIGECFLAPGYSTEYMYFFLATELSPSPLSADIDEDISAELVPLAEIPRLVAEGQLRDAKSLAALYLARPWLESRG
jgi:ADP-ribose pyrophosphatase